MLREIYAESSGVRHLRQDIDKVSEELLEPVGLVEGAQRQECLRSFQRPDSSRLLEALADDGLAAALAGQVDLMMPPFDSYARASLSKGEAPCRRPYERFAFEHGEEIARRLGIVPIPLKEVTLRPEPPEVK